MFLITSSIQIETGVVSRFYTVSLIPKPKYKTFCFSGVQMKSQKRSQELDCRRPNDRTTLYGPGVCRLLYRLDWLLYKNFPFSHFIVHNDNWYLFFCTTSHTYLTSGSSILRYKCGKWIHKSFLNVDLVVVF